MKELKIAKNLSLPLSAATQKIACLGMTGSGKSYLQTKIVEFFLDNDVQTVYLDPKGEGWGLRLMADGKTPAFSIPVFGGEHGDYPLNHTMGKQIAETLVKGDYSAILDVSEFISSELSQFGYDFATRLFQLKKKKPGAMSLVIDEAQDFIPQNPQEKGYEPKMLGAFERIGKQLRSKGVGMVIAGQRPQEINKKVLNMCEIWFAFQMTGLSERETMEKIFRDKDREEANKVFQVLPQLEVGQAHIWSPRFLKVSDNYNILPKKTLDTSATPEVGGKKVVARKLSPLDDKALSSAMEEFIQKAKENDPAELHKKIADLTKENAKLAANKNIQQPAKNVATISKPSNDKAYKTAIDKREKEIGIALKTIYKVKDKAMDLIADLTTEINKMSTALQPLGIVATIDLKTSSELTMPPITNAMVDKRREFTPKPIRTSSTQNGGLTGPEQRVIDAILWLNTIGINQPDKQQVGFIAGYRIKKVGGTYGNALGSLRTKGLVEYPNIGMVILTDEGRSIANDSGIERTTEGLQAAIMERLDGPERRVLTNLIQAYPNPLDKIELGALSGYQVVKVGGTYGNALGSLRSLGLISYPSTGMARANDLLFID